MEEHSGYEGEEEDTRICDLDRKYSPIPVCKCLTSEKSSEKTPIDPKKQQIYTTASRTEEYLTNRRIPELIRFFMTKIITSGSKSPVIYLENLLDECMLFRSGLGLPPVLYERRHLEAIAKSFDPGNRGWLSPSQIRRVLTTVGLPPLEHIVDNTPTGLVIDLMEKVQEAELYKLVSSGMDLGVSPQPNTSSSSDNIIDMNV